MSTGVIFILGKGVSPILASGVKSTWPQGSSEPGFSTTGFISFLKTAVLGDIVLKIIENDIINIYGSDFYSGAIFKCKIFDIFLDFFIGIHLKSILRTNFSFKVLRRGRTFHNGRFLLFYGGYGNLFAGWSLGNSHDFTATKKRLKAVEHIFDY